MASSRSMERAASIRVEAPASLLTTTPEEAAPEEEVINTNKVTPGASMSTDVAANRFDQRWTEYNEQPFFPQVTRSAPRVIPTLFVIGYIMAAAWYFYCRFTGSIPQGQYQTYGYFILAVELLGVSSLLSYALLLPWPTLVPQRKDIALPAAKSEDWSLPPGQKAWFHVRVLVPCYKEDLSIIKATIEAALKADLPAFTHRTIYLCDDGGSKDKENYVNSLQAKHGADSIKYVSGRYKTSSAEGGDKNGKSCNLNNCLKRIIYSEYRERSGSLDASHYNVKINHMEVPDNEVVVVFDADMRAEKHFFTTILAAMKPDIDLCLTPQAFDNLNFETDIFNHRNLQFWEYVLPGSNTYGYIACTGTNFCIRAKALAAVDFFPTYTITEDYALGMELAKAGFKGTYLNTYLAKGEAPTGPRDTFKQRSRWTKGHMEVFFSLKCPLFQWRLSMANRWLFTNGTWAYFATVITTPTFFAVPFLSLAFGIHPVTLNRQLAIAATLYFFCTWLVQNYCRIYNHSKSLYFGQISNQILSFTYTKAIISILLEKVGAKMPGGFKVTVKKTADAVANTPLARSFSNMLQRNNSKLPIHNSRTEINAHPPSAPPTTIVVPMGPPSEKHKERSCCAIKGDMEGTLDMFVLTAYLLLALATMALGIWRWVIAESLDSYVVLPMFWAAYNLIPPYLFIHYLITADDKGNSGSLRFGCMLARLLSSAFAIMALVALYFTVPVDIKPHTALQMAVDFLASARSGPIPPGSTTNPSYAYLSSYTPPKTDVFTIGDKTVDLSGGWFVNSGSNVKFGFPLATSASMLAWAYSEFKGGFDKAGTTASLKAQLRVAGDYLMAAHYAEKKFIAQVGNPQKDKLHWSPPSYLASQFDPTTRPYYELTDATGGADLIAASAAALAGISAAFKDSDRLYADQALLHAKQLYAWATSPRMINTTYCNTAYTGISCAHLDRNITTCTTGWNEPAPVLPASPSPKAGAKSPPPPSPPPRTGVYYRRLQSDYSAATDNTLPSVADSSNNLNSNQRTLLQGGKKAAASPIPSPSPSPPPYSWPPYLNVTCKTKLQVAYYYPSNSIYDDLAWAAALLFKASPTDSEEAFAYQDDADKYLKVHMEQEFQAANTSSYLPTYDNMAWAASTLLYDLTDASPVHHSRVKTFLQAWLPGAKLPFYDQYGFRVAPVEHKKKKHGTLAWSHNQTLPNAMTAAMYTMVISKSNRFDHADKRTMRCWAYAQARFALLGGGRSRGSRYSYMVGYGSKYPKNPQSRVAACRHLNSTQGKGSCDYDSALTTSRQNPHVLAGALVAGPDKNMTFNDIRYSDSNKVGVDYNVGITGLLAALLDDSVKVTNEECQFGQGVYQSVFDKLNIQRR